MKSKGEGEGGAGRGGGRTCVMAPSVASRRDTAAAKRRSPPRLVKQRWYCGPITCGPSTVGRAGQHTQGLAREVKTGALKVVKGWSRRWDALWLPGTREPCMASIRWVTRGVPRWSGGCAQTAESPCRRTTAAPA